MDVCYKPYRFVLKIILIIGLNFISSAQFSTAQSTDSLLMRSPSKERIEKFKGDDTFNYGRDFKEPQSPFERFYQWLIKQLDKFLSSTNYDNFWKWIYLAVIIAVVIMIIKKTFGKEFSILFKSNNKTLKLPYDVMHENIHELDFELEINNAIEQHNYRLAIRYMYLKSLKALTDSGIINWHPEKTNRAYLQEIKNEMQRGLFENLTTIFEFTWYGDKPVNEESFVKDKVAFQEFLITKF